MASLFSSKAQGQGAKVIPNGGLGGLVYHGPEAQSQEKNRIETLPISKFRHRPPPLRIASGDESPAALTDQLSAVSSMGFGSLWTPKTPTDSRKQSQLGTKPEIIPSPLTPLTSRYNSAVPNKPFVSPPETPIALKEPSLVELPGSLLLPSQGFPQSNPISPPPSLRLPRRNTEESDLSSTPSLSISISSDDASMDTLRHLTARKHDRSRSGSKTDMPSYTIGSRGPISKPFGVMTIEDLLDNLSDCDHATIIQHWLPAMRSQIQSMITLLTEAGNLQLESSVDQITLNEVLKNFSDQMRAVTAEYRKVVETAESLAERDTQTNNDRVKELEEQVEQAVEMMETKDNEIEERARRISELRSTLHEVVRHLGAFIQSNLSNWVDTIHEPRTQQILRIIADYTSTEEQSTAIYVRVPEGTLNTYATDLREARDTISEYRKVLHGQGGMIKDQSQKLDTWAEKYEGLFRLVQERDHEIILLAQQNTGLIKQLQDCQTALGESQQATEEAEIAGRRYDELRGNMESLKTAHELELDQKDAEILNLRQKLGSAREEVFARRADVKNVVAQTQAMLQAQPDVHSATPKNTNASKALRFFGMEKDKYKKSSIPGSQSSLGLSSVVDDRYSSKEVAPAVSKDALLHRPSLQTHTNPRSARTTPNTPLDNSQLLGEPTWTAPMFRPRSDSLAPTQLQSSALAPPADRYKPLPEEPVSRTQLTSARLADITSSIESPLQAQITSDYLSHGIMGQTSQSTRRVLSRITEASASTPERAGDANPRLSSVPDDNDSEHSIASSDREVYRKSICALDLLNSSSGLPHSETEPDMGRDRDKSDSKKGATSPPPRSQSRHPAATYNNNQGIEMQEEGEDAHTGLARVLHLRPGTRDLRRARGSNVSESAIDQSNRNDGTNASEGVGTTTARPIYSRGRASSDQSIRIHRDPFRNPARESMVSNDSSAGYRTEDSEPKTVAQLYHMGGRHIRG